MKILLACDRSKGHSYPALVLARHIKKYYPQHSVVFYGLKKKDRRPLRAEGFRCFGLDIGRRHIIIEGIWFFFEALALIAVIRPGRVIGFGGRNSFFALLFSSLFVKVFLFEPNATFGRANRLLAFVSRKVFLGLKEPSSAKEVGAGIPLRKEITQVTLSREEALERLKLDSDKRTILVFGGSSGSTFINETFFAAASLLKEKEVFQVIHITGPRDLKRMRTSYEQAGIKACVVDFFPQMGILYRACDCLVSRSGASTVAEVAFSLKPALLIPYPYACGHQVKNAQFLSRRKAACMAEQFSLNKERLRDIVKGLLTAPAPSESLRIWTDGQTFSRKVLSHIC
jgi:UDP-N-acetylglucosamine--N-acetylmuramyl-(pentapeptide) pyrophosphoryl-undecaprenol N-acetylglucosamine transferase